MSVGGVFSRRQDGEAEGGQWGKGHAELAQDELFNLDCATRPIDFIRVEEDYVG
jgi:hypothetical protein